MCPISFPDFDRAPREARVLWGRNVEVVQLGRVPYGPTHELQQELHGRRLRGEIPDTILVLEHDPVITLGRSARAAHILASPEALRARGISLHAVGRGGDVTFHGPGQLIVYPIVDLSPDRRDVRKHMSWLEGLMIAICGRFGLQAGRSTGRPGAWIEDRKIGAVGVRISRWVTMHGLALNVCPDLACFELIVPCGIRDARTTSIAAELGREVTVAEAIEPLITSLARA